MKTKASVASIGMDVHHKFSTISFRDEDGRVVQRQRLDHPDRGALVQRVRQWPKGAVVVMEASFGWGWLSDLLTEEGFAVALSNCYKLKQMRKARGWVKTNKKDADLLSLLPMEATAWWQVWRAPPAVRDLREWTRLRMVLVRMETIRKNRIHALFHRHGIFHGFSDLFGTKGRGFLLQLCQNGSPHLPTGAQAALRSEVRLLDQVRAERATVTRRLRTMLKANPGANRLRTISGIGWVLAQVIYAEIGQIRRFRHAKALAAYCLLAPLADETGDQAGGTPLGRHLGDRGHRTLKWAFLEAAHGAVRAGGHFREYFDRHTAGGTADRNRGYIKVARLLVNIVYAVWRDERDYRPATRRPVRKDQPGRGQASRSGTGRPNQPMVVG